MLVDPLTIGAQIINFVILVVALKYLLYDRVIEAMDTRQGRIADALHEAEEREAEAAEEAARLRQQGEELEEQREQRLRRAEQDAEERREELTDQARRDVAALEQDWREGMARQQDRLLRDLRRGAAGRVVEIARRALADLADTNLEDRIVEVFEQRLVAAEDELPQQPTGPLEIHTAFALDDARRERLEAAMRKQYGDEPQVRFVRDASLLAGIEVHVDGHAIGWNLDDYLDELDQSVRELLQSRGSDA